MHVSGHNIGVLKPSRNKRLEDCKTPKPRTYVYIYIFFLAFEMDHYLMNQLPLEALL